MHLNSKDLYRYTGNESQLFGVRRLIIDEGNARGAVIYNVTTAGGLDFDILADTGLDMGRLKFCGVNINYMTKNGYDSPARFLPVPDNFDHTFPGGMLYTCGLLNVGPQCTDTRGDNEFHPLHGRYHGNSASNLFAYSDNENIYVGGEVRETEQWRHAFSIKRKYKIPVWSSEIFIEDEIKNLTPNKFEYSILYHVNFGWPFLSERTRLILPAGCETKPRTDYARDKISSQCIFSQPIDNEPECVYFNETGNNCEPKAEIINDELKITASLEWSKDTLPRLSQWKSMRSGEYVLGLEPSTCYTMGRSDEREHGELRILEGFGVVKNNIKLSFKRV